jgi:predicted nucleotide-binding protein
LAKELASRLRERSKFIRIPNARPVIFIGSSVEGLPVAQEIQLGLSKTYAVPKIWTDDLFIAGHTTMEDLSKAVATADFGVLVCTPDDKTTNKARKVNQIAPRDNVILELGMCLSALGLHRTLAVIPRTTSVKMPSDLLGVTPIKYTDDDPANLAAHVGPVCTEITKIVQKEGVR